MAIQLPSGLDIVNPVPVDFKYGPYASTAAAKAAIPLALRYDGLTVQVTGTGEFHWLAADLTDPGLVAKGGSGISGLTTDFLTKATSATTIGNSLFQDNGAQVSVGTTPTATQYFSINNTSEDFGVVIFQNQSSPTGDSISLAAQTSTTNTLGVNYGMQFTVFGSSISNYGVQFSVNGSSGDEKGILFSIGGSGGSSTGISMDVTETGGGSAFGSSFTIVGTGTNKAYSASVVNNGALIANRGVDITIGGTNATNINIGALLTFNVATASGSQHIGVKVDMSAITSNTPTKYGFISNGNPFHGFNILTPTATGHFKGRGNTLSTFAIKVDSSTVNDLFNVRDDGFSSFGVAAVTSTRLFIQGSGTTSATFGLQVHDSTGSNNGFIVRNDGFSSFGTTPTTTYRVNIDGSTTVGGINVVTSLTGGVAISVTSNTAGAWGVNATANGSAASAAIRGTTTIGSAGEFIASSTAGVGVKANSAIGTSLYSNQDGTLAANTTAIGTRIERTGVIGAFDFTGALLSINSTVADTGHLVHIIKQTVDTFVINSTKNIGIGTGTFGASMIGGFAMKTGTNPTGNVTDVFQMYSADIVSGNAAPHFRTEASDIVKLFKGAAVADAAGGAIIDAEARTAINALLARMRVTGGNGLIAD